MRLRSRVMTSLVLPLLLLTAAGSAVASVIDFESVPVGPIAGDTLMINVDGVDVTFTGPGLQIRQFGGSFPNTRVLSTSVDAGPITITFGGGFTADFVEITNIISGTFTAEVDIIDGSAFDALGNLLDFVSNSNAIHHLDGPGIAKVIYVENSPGQGFVLDDFTFRGEQRIPEPATLLLLGFGLAGLSGLAWRRHRRRA